MTNPERVQIYIDYLLKEIKLYEDSSRIIDTIYFGGGTPSVLTSQQMSQLMNAIYKNFNVDSRAEISTEMNPESVTFEKLKNWKSLGFNRFSMGAQSFCDDVLRVMGRIHRQKDIYERMNWFQQLNLDNVSLDLMFNNPGQTLEVLEADLDQALSLNLAHFSIYSLMIEPGTQFERWLKKDRIRVADDEQEREMYYVIQDKLSSHGFEQYEFSNFARPGKMCQHNLKYWRQADYFGLGIGASGNIGDLRYDNANNFLDYFRALDRGDKPIGKSQRLTHEEREVEFIMLNMRLLRGMSISEINQRYDTSFEEKYKEALEKNKKAGLIIRDGDYLKFTPRGLDLANQFYLDLI